MVQMYERHSKIVQEKVQELFAILDRIGTVISSQFSALTLQIS